MAAGRRGSGWLLGALALAGWIVAGILWIRGGSAGFPPIDSRMPAVESSSELAEVLRAAASEPGFEAAAVAFCLLDAAGQVVFESPLAATALTPASALKSLTVAAALELLGPEFRFETRLLAPLPPDAAGVVAGNLRLVGGGDPTLSFADLDALARAAVDGGLRRVTGGLVADASAFPEHPMSEHWNWGDIGNAYGAGAFGLNVNHNRMLAFFKAGRMAGDPVEFLGSDPTPGTISWVNRLTTGPPGSGDRSVVFSEPYGRTITLRGSIPAGETRFAVRAALPDPPAVALAWLRDALATNGVVFGERDADGPPPAELQTLAVHHSAPLRQIIGHLQRVSDNLEAQCVFLMMGRQLGRDPAMVLRDYWKRQGVAFAGLRLLDGSGLARATMIRPLDLARANYLARHGGHGELFHASLPVLGDGAIRSKPGAMSGVRSDAGFIASERHGELTFALVTNGLGPQADYRRLREQLLTAARNGGF
jgi:D-alanyl-D-alanine carboxypeptidase/D-alanyl-D-alanine-endopeptidase (penicillin-binding protein 4)